MKFFTKKIHIIFVIIASLLLQSCATQNMKIVEGGFTSGVKVRELADKDYPIIFGKLSVYDHSNNLSPNESNISDSCLVFVGNDPMVPSSMFYGYNWPNIGQSSNVYKGFFAIQLRDQNVGTKNLNVACGTEYYARKRIKFFWDGIVDYHSYLRIDMEKPLNIKSALGNKALYLGDVEVFIPDDAIMRDSENTYLEKVLSVGYYRTSIERGINHTLRVKDNFKQTSEDLTKILPFVKQDFVFEKSIMH